MRQNRIALIAAWLLIFPLCAPALAWRGQVAAVTDGDSLAVIREGNGQRVTIRLHGIDAPERADRRKRWPAQPYSRRAAAFLRQLLRPEAGGPFVEVAVVELGRDRYGRTLAGVVTLPEGKLVQEELLRAGLAWVYVEYCKDCRAWRELEAEARAARRGLWQDAAPTPPWEWRHGAARR